MNPNKFTEEHIEWLNKNFNKYNKVRDLTKAFNKKFKLNYDVDSLRRRCRRSDLHYSQFRYTNEMLEYLKEIRDKVTTEECAEAFNKKFNTECTIAAINKICIQNKIYTDRDCRFKPGQTSFSKGLKGDDYKALLSKEAYKRMQKTQWKRKYALNKPFWIDGRLYICEIGGGGKNYKDYLKYMYEKHYNVSLDRYQTVIPLDGNFYNTSKENLYALNKSGVAGCTRKNIKNPYIICAINEIRLTEKIIKEMEK